MPSPPPLTRILHEHLRRFGTAGDGRLFRNLLGGDLAESAIARILDRARKTVLTEVEYAFPLARRPYDLRHACVSTWLAAAGAADGEAALAEVAMWPPAVLRGGQSFGLPGW